jgi:hypothetical protein
MDEQTTAILDNMLDEYEKSLSLPKFVELKNNEVIKLLDVKKEVLEKMSIQECAEAALVLGSFSFYLQRSYNREYAKAQWADQKIKEIISGKENQYRGSWESQYYQAIRENKVAEKLLNAKKHAESRCNRINYLANNVKHMSDLYINMQKAKVVSL